jgi:hypothetical protein
VNCGYDDWYEENAPCSKESSRRSRSRSSDGWIAEFRLVNMPRMLILTATLFVVLVIAFASGCGNNRTIFVPEDSPMRLGPNARSRVWVRVDGSKEWVLSGNTIDLPEGWYIVPSSYVRPEDGK